MNWHIEKVSCTQLRVEKPELIPTIKSSELRENDPIKVDYMRTVAVNDLDKLTFKQKLCFCNDEVAPTTIKKGKFALIHSMTYLLLTQ